MQGKIWYFNMDTSFVIFRIPLQLYSESEIFSDFTLQYY